MNRTKVILRRLPPDLSSEEFWDVIAPLNFQNSITWKEFFPGSFGILPEETRYSYAFIAFNSSESAFDFYSRFTKSEKPGEKPLTHAFKDRQGNSYVCSCEWSPVQKVPSSSSYRNSKAGTYEQDSLWNQFLAVQEDPTSQLPSTNEIVQPEDSKANMTSPLVAFLLQQSTKKHSHHEEEEEEGRKKKDKEKKKRNEKESKRDKKDRKEREKESHHINEREKESYNEPPPSKAKDIKKESKYKKKEPTTDDTPQSSFQPKPLSSETAAPSAQSRPVLVMRREQPPQSSGTSSSASSHSRPIPMATPSSFAPKPAPSSQSQRNTQTLFSSQYSMPNILAGLSSPTSSAEHPQSQPKEPERTPVSNVSEEAQTSKSQPSRRPVRAGVTWHVKKKKEPTE